MGLWEIITLIIAGITSIASATFYIRSQSVKANLDGKDATIATLTRQRDAVTDENVMLRTENAEMKGEIKTLRSLATQTPEIIKLTEAVTHLTDGVTVQGKQTTKMLATTVKLLRALTKTKVTEEESANEHYQ